MEVKLKKRIYKRKKIKYGFFFDENFKLRTKKERRLYLQKNVFEQPLFIEHVTQVSMILDMDRKVIEDVLKHYIQKVSDICEKPMLGVTRIIHFTAMANIKIFPGNRI